MAYLYCNISAHRLGNALFMAASTIGIARANGMEPLFPANWKYRQYFNLPDEMFGSTIIEARYKEPHFHFAAPDIDSSKNTEIEGYFQSERYWHHCREEVISYLTPKGIEPGSIEAVAIHHRRGDYVGNPNYQQLGMGYYISAYDTFFKGKEIRAFSDDHNYIDLHYGGNTLKAKPSPDIEDFKNMVACKYHICSNSTFSWWGAYLSGCAQPIRPGKYFDGPLAERNKEDDFWPYHWREWQNDFKCIIDDVTFIIPFMYDHANRLENLAVIIDFLKKHFECHKIIGEINTYMVNANGGRDWVDEKYILPNFHRTYVLNDMTRKATTPYVFNLDADVVFSPWQIYAAVEKLRNGADIVYPFGGTVANVPRAALRPFFQTLDCGVFAGRQWPWMNSTYKSVGMAVGYNKESFLKAGGENEEYVSYASEDQERYMRFRRLGLKVERVPGTAFHLEHWRGPDSSERHPDSKRNGELITEEIKTYRDWYLGTSDKDDWRPYQSTVGRICSW
jgi:hypothetical protein